MASLKEIDELREGIMDGGTFVTMSEEEYRALKAIVDAARAWLHDSGDGDTNALVDAVEALERAEEGKG
jgi:hypothetical protein